MTPKPNLLKFIFKLAICLILVAWILHTVFAGEAENGLKLEGRNWAELSLVEKFRESWTKGPSSLWKTTSNVELGWLMISLIFMGFTIVIGVIRWRIVLSVQGLKFSFRRAMGISLVAHFFNSFLLGATGGDLLKAYFASEETSHKKVETITTVAVDRLLGLFSMLLFCSILALINWDVVISEKRFMAVMLLVLSMLFLSGMFMMLSFWGGPTNSRLKFELFLKKLPKGVSLVRCIEACRSYGEKPSFLPRVLGWSMLLNFACVMQILALGLGLGLDMGSHLLVIMLIVPAVICISALPITPSGIGIRENLYVALLSSTAIGIDQKAALSLSILAFAGSLLWSLVGGIVYFFFRSKNTLDRG
ncbi:MAG: hypothetical protein CMO69_05905 [Verrucomicrobiales bacterium]|nr:hypothetical protein [Verrucomicrobiales bacterium]